MVRPLACQQICGRKRNWNNRKRTEDVIPVWIRPEENDKECGDDTKQEGVEH